MAKPDHQRATAGSDRPWWEGGVVYQVYPRSFQDSNDDGVGDLAGIEQRLDYVSALGVDAIWLSPIFPSPMADFGYDVADYVGIDPIFGTLDDFDRLLAAVHARGLKLLLDFVPNHCSDQHQWFIESRASRTNAKRDWFIWQPPAPGGGPPNNWISDFGGSAWELDAASGEYYLHAFLREQPDLNWRNPAVRTAMYDVMRFWFERGVDGFRIDVLWHIAKAAGFPDNPVNPDWQKGMNARDCLLQQHSTDQPEAHEWSAEMRAIADSYGERLLVGEIFLPNRRLARWYGSPERPQVHLPFNFALIENDWNAPAIAALIDDYERSIPEWGWPNWVIGSHDAPRIAARVGAAQARVAMMLLLTLRGTPTLYQGDELGIGEVAITPDRVCDPREIMQPGIGLGRDRSRTPMPWENSDHAGFSDGEPWLPLNPDWPERNVAAQQRDPTSMLTFTIALLALRRAQPALSVGEIAQVDGTSEVLTYVRRNRDNILVIALNLGGHASRATVAADGPLVPLLSTLGTPAFETLAYGAAIPLRPNEGIVLRVSA